MAEIKVSEMLEAEQVNDEDLIMIVQNGVNKKVPASKVGTGQAGGDTLPIGSILQCSVNDIPKNWLLCDGSEVNRVKYADLFNKIGTTYGEGDGSTTFNLPDLRGRVPVGKDETDEDFDTLGNTGGEKEHTLTINEMPSHNHQSSNYFEGSGGTSGMWAVRSLADLTGYKDSSSQTGGNQPHNNLQPYTVINYIIKALQSSSSATTAEVLPVGSEIEFDGDAEEIPVGWEEVDNVLWVKDRSINNFPAQTITLSSSDYDYLIIYYHRTPASRTEMFSSIIEKNQTTELLYNDYFNNIVRSWSRSVNINETSVAFGDCAINGETTNAGLIPCKIVGLKY